jgi:hypothetical protein
MPILFSEQRLAALVFSAGYYLLPVIALYAGLQMTAKANNLVKNKVLPTSVGLVFIQLFFVLLVILAAWVLRARYPIFWQMRLEILLSILVLCGVSRQGIKQITKKLDAHGPLETAVSLAAAYFNLIGIMTLAVLSVFINCHSLWVSLKIIILSVAAALGIVGSIYFLVKFQLLSLRSIILKVLLVIPLGLAVKFIPQGYLLISLSAGVAISLIIPAFVEEWSREEVMSLLSFVSLCLAAALAKPELRVFGAGLAVYLLLLLVYGLGGWALARKNEFIDSVAPALGLMLNKHDAQGILLILWLAGQGKQLYFWQMILPVWLAVYLAEAVFYPIWAQRLLKKAGEIK